MNTAETEEANRIMDYKSFDELPMFISIPQAAKLLGVSDKFLYNQHKNGSTFPVIEMGRCKVVPTDQFRKWVEENCK